MQSGWQRRASHTVQAGPVAGGAGAAEAGPPTSRVPEPRPCADGQEPRPCPEPAGCGWFESSRTLREGTDVQEHQVLDPIVNDLPLAWWIEWAGLQADTRRT